ncbi:MAG: hypothetical protein SFY66_27575 [Oculatellaceae cyanobacterium bins.114]|nr:hypothetical protein [Oculatellaceae cyanobacterium bins.114]
MKLTKYVGLFLVASVASLSVWLWNSLPAASQATVQLQTNPPIDQVIPATEPVQLTLQAIDSHQQPLADANFQVQLLTPAKTPWFTSDFPIVEGTTLLEINAIAPSGSFQFEQTLPIRGTYHLEVNVSPQTPGSFEPFDQVISFSVPENPVKYRNVAILAVILLLAGAGSGWVLGADQILEEGEIAPRPVRMLLSAAIVLAIAVLLVINISSEITEGHGSHSHEHEQAITSSAPATQTSQDIQVTLSGDTLATVGQTATQTVQIVDATTQKAVPDVVVNVQVNSLEHNERIFSLEGLPNTSGELIWQQQFFDGAPHQVIATIAPTGSSSRQFLPIQVSHEVSVEAIAPPLYIRFITLIYFTAIFVVSLGIGFIIQRKTGHSKWRVGDRVG